MQKNKIKLLGMMCAVISVSLAVTSCSVSDLLGPKTETTTTTAATTSKRVIDTTKTAMYVNGDVSGEDDDVNYTSSVSITGGSLENDYSEPDEYDEDIRATMTTKATTLYTMPPTTTTKKGATTTKKTTQTTAFTADALYNPTDDMMYSSSKKRIVNSDTTYLNLRFGPSKDYSVQLKIPNEAEIKIVAETKDSDGNSWVYTSYKGTKGWVMKGLLKK